MVKFLGSILAFFGLTTGAHADETSGQSAHKTVLAFAEQFLDPEAKARLSDPAATGYYSYADMDVFDPTQLSDSDWANILIDEILNWSGTGCWLDWKNNIYTLIEREDGEPSYIDQVFESAGTPKMSDNEIARVTAKAESEGGHDIQLLMMPELQPLARDRGLRLMSIDNNSDGTLLFALPEGKAGNWHLIQIGKSLIFNADAGVVLDPRNGGQEVRLSN